MKNTFIFSSQTILTCTLFIIVHCTPPNDPIRCEFPDRNTNCTVTNFLGAFPDRTTCRAASAIYPTSESDVISAVANATASGKKMKVCTRYSQSIPKLVCPGGNEGILISTKHLDRVISVNAKSMTMTTESGATLRQVIDRAAEAGMALPYTPYWWGATVGGMLSTGAHGSSLWGIGSQVHDHVIRLKIVSPGTPGEGYVKIRTLESGDPDLDAAKVSLGVLGVITQVTLRLQPLFKRSVTLVTRDDSRIGQDAVSFGRKHEFADFTWYPSQKRVVYRIDDRVGINTSGNGHCDFPGFRSTASLALVALRAIEETQESWGYGFGKCMIARLAASALRVSTFGLTNNGLLFTRYPVIGFHNRIQASGSCLDSPWHASIAACPWDPRVGGVFYHQTTFGIGLSKVESFINNVKRLVDLDPSSLCGLNLYNGILMRYVTASSAYLGKEEDGMAFDITYYRSTDPLKPRLGQEFLEEIEQMAVFKYGALPHWGKNRNVAFIGAIGKYRNAKEFMEVKARYDESGLFSSEWTDQVLGLRDGLSVEREGCALEGLCVCSRDVHCAPRMGYVCRPGKVYEDARVCSKLHSYLTEL